MAADLWRAQPGIHGLCRGARGLRRQGHHLAPNEKGVIDLAGLLGTARDDTLVYCCGPEALLNAVEQACEPWPSGSLHIERFAAKAIDVADSDAGPGSFEVICQRSGTTVTVPEAVTVLDAFEEAGMGVMGRAWRGLVARVRLE